MEDLFILDLIHLPLWQISYSRESLLIGILDKAIQDWTLHDYTYIGSKKL